MPREPRDLSQLEAESERVGTDWRMKPPTTEQEVAQLSMREAVLPAKVQRLRQKVSVTPFTSVLRWCSMSGDDEQTGEMGNLANLVSRVRLVAASYPVVGWVHAFDVAGLP